MPYGLTNYDTAWICHCWKNGQYFYKTHLTPYLSVSNILPKNFNLHNKHQNSNRRTLFLYSEKQTSWLTIIGQKFRLTPGLYSRCVAHTQPTDIVMWTFPDSAIKGKSQKGLKDHYGRLIDFLSQISSCPISTCLIQLIFYASLVSRFVFWFSNWDVC